MKGEFNKSVVKENNVFFQKAEENFNQWCVNFFNTIYKNMDLVDRVYITIDQSCKNREVLKPFSYPENNTVVLNCSASAVIMLEAAQKGLSFECAFGGKPFYDTYGWDEILSVTVTDPKGVILTVPLDPIVINTILENGSHHLDEQQGAYVDIEERVVNNVHYVDFSKKK